MTSWLCGHAGDKGTEDPFEGLTPKQIVMFCEKYNIDPTDPLEVCGHQLQVAGCCWLHAVCCSNTQTLVVNTNC